MPWINCGPEFIETDVIRWTEGVFRPSHWGRKGKRIRVGERVIIAQVMHDTRNLAGEVDLRVIKSEGKYPLHADEQVMRRRRTLSREETERLAWTEEEARNSVLACTPPIHEGKATYKAMGSSDGSVAPISSPTGSARGGGSGGGPIWGRRSQQHSGPRM